MLLLCSTNNYSNVMECPSNGPLLGAYRASTATVNSFCRSFLSLISYPYCALLLWSAVKLFNPWTIASQNKPHRCFSKRRATACCHPCGHYVCAGRPKHSCTRRVFAIEPLLAIPGAVEGEEVLAATCCFLSTLRVDTAATPWPHDMLPSESVILYEGRKLLQVRESTA